MSRRSSVTALAVAAVVGIGLPLVPAQAASSTGSISGVAFEDANRNGVRDTGERGLSGHRIYFLDGSGAYAGQALTATDGSYSIAGLAAAGYTVTYDSTTWGELRDAWVPTTTGSLRPERQATAPASGVDFGWRPITTSTDPAAPLTTLTGPDGLRVWSYTDAVTASEVHAALRRGVLVGAEATAVLIRFGLTTTSSATTSATQVDGTYTSFSATVNLDYRTWLDSGDRALFHEYGHAWSLYYAYLAQDDPSLSDYRTRRGLADDTRVGSSYAWDLKELIAEDYRQLFGSETAKQWTQVNLDVPPPGQVPGLEDWLRGAFREKAAEASATAPLEIESLSLSPLPVERTATAVVRLSAPASLTVRIETGRGAVVRTLANGKAAVAGDGSFTWDRLDDRGRTVKRGTYVLRAVADDGARRVERTLEFKVA